MLSFETELHVAFNVAALLLNARDTNRFVKEQSVGTILTTGQKLALFYKQIIAMIFDKPKRMEFLSCSISIAPLCGMLDELPGDPHLVSIFRSCLRESKDLMRTVALLDLLLCCGENEHERILLELKKANHLGVTFAMYWRVATLYFFRFHRDVDRAALRKLLTSIRKLERGVELPKLV